MLGKPSFVARLFCYIIITIVLAFIAFPAVAWFVKAKPWTELSQHDYAKILVQVSAVFAAWTAVALLGRRWPRFRLSWIPDTAKGIAACGAVTLVFAAGAVYLGGKELAGLVIPALLGGLMGGVALTWVLNRVRMPVSDLPER